MLQGNARVRTGVFSARIYSAILQTRKLLGGGRWLAGSEPVLAPLEAPFGSCAVLPVVGMSGNKRLPPWLYTPLEARVGLLLVGPMPWDTVVGHVQTKPSRPSVCRGCIK